VGSPGSAQWTTFEGGGGGGIGGGGGGGGVGFGSPSLRPSGARLGYAGSDNASLGHESVILSPTTPGGRGRAMARTPSATLSLANAEALGATFVDPTSVEGGVVASVVLAGHNAAAMAAAKVLVLPPAAWAAAGMGGGGHGRHWRRRRRRRRGRGRGRQRRGRGRRGQRDAIKIKSIFMFHAAFGRPAIKYEKSDADTPRSTFAASNWPFSSIFFAYEPLKKSAAGVRASL
jgi:hypothetical protein